MWSHPIWILVADGQHARVLERPSRDAEWREREEDCMSCATQPSPGSGLERPGRPPESVGMARHGIALHASPQEEAEMEFARLLLDRLEHRARETCYRRLYIAAPPRLMGYLREGLGRATRMALQGTLDRDLGRQPVSEVVALLHAHDPLERS